MLCRCLSRKGEFLYTSGTTFFYSADAPQIPPLVVVNNGVEARTRVCWAQDRLLIQANATVVWYGYVMYGEVDSGITDLCALTMFSHFLYCTGAPEVYYVCGRLY